MFTSDAHNNTLTEILADPRKRAEWVKYQLRLRGTNLNRLAQLSGCGRSTMTGVWHRSNARVEALLAETLGVSPYYLFPERYHSDGTRIQRRGRPTKRAKRSRV